MTKASWEGKILFGFYTSTSPFTTERSQDRSSKRAGTWKQELKRRPWRSAASWLAHHGLLSLSGGRHIGCEGHACFIVQLSGMSLTVFQALPHQSLIKKMPYRLSYQQSWGIIFSVNIPSSQISSLCQIDKTSQPSTHQSMNRSRDVWR